MNDKEYEIVEKVLGLITNGAQGIVTDYGYWHLYNAIGWVVLSLIAIVASVVFARKAEDTEVKLSLIVVIVIAAINLFSQVPDILAPEAKAVHQLIRDIRGS